MADQIDHREGETSESADDGVNPEPKKPIWPWIVASTVVLLFFLIVVLLLFVPRSHVKTDDASVSVRYANIAPEVSGKVATVNVADNDLVHAGQLLLTIDDRNYSAALSQALATYAADRAQTEQAISQVQRQPALIKQAQAQIAQAQAALILSRPRAARYTLLSSTGAASLEQRQQAFSQLRGDEANLQSAQANLLASKLQLLGLRADRASARAKADADYAQVQQARLNLSYTRIFAPFDGTVDQRAVQVGNYVTPGAGVMVLVPLSGLYIIANYREPALRHMRPGQQARIHVDAYDIWLDGIVQSLPAATGSSYSPIPSNNATGNFTKIVQRLPVKIVVAPHQPLARLLRVGMSVETIVDTGLTDVVAEQRRAADSVTLPVGHFEVRPAPGAHR